MPVPILTEVELEMKMEIIVLQTQMKEAKERLTEFASQISELSLSLVQLASSVKPMMGFSTASALLEPDELILADQSQFVIPEGYVTTLYANDTVFTINPVQKPYTPGDLVIDLGNGITGTLTDFDPATGIGQITMSGLPSATVVSIGFNLETAEEEEGAVIDELLAQPDGMMARDF